MELNLQYFSMPIGHQGMGIKPNGKYNSSKSKATSKASPTYYYNNPNYGPQDSSAIQHGFDYNGNPIAGLDLSGVNWSQPTSVNFQNPSQVYSATHGLGNAVYASTFGDLTLNVPAWIYDNGDGINGEGVLSFATFQGRTKTHHLYRDLDGKGYFYVTRHGKNNGHGYEPTSRQSLSYEPASFATGLSDPGRLIADATVGTDDSYEQSSDPGRFNACVVFVGDPHLTREQYMNCVYPHFDNPAAQGITLNSNAQNSTILNETYDDPHLTPNEDSEQNNSPKSGSPENSNIKSNG